MLSRSKLLATTSHRVPRCGPWVELPSTTMRKLSQQAMRLPADTSMYGAIKSPQMWAPSWHPHRRTPSAIRAGHILRRLEQQLERLPGSSVPDGSQDLGSTQQHGPVVIMTAGMHHARVLAGKGRTHLCPRQAVRLVRAQSHNALAGLCHRGWYPPRRGRSCTVHFHSMAWAGLLGTGRWPPNRTAPGRNSQVAAPVDDVIIVLYVGGVDICILLPPDGSFAAYRGALAQVVGCKLCVHGRLRA